MATNPELVICHFSTKINETELCECNFPQCRELCRWQPGQGNRASSVHTHRCDFNTQLWQMRIFFKAICVLKHLKRFLPEATCRYDNYSYSLQLQTPSEWRQSSSWVWCSKSSSTSKACNEFNRPAHASCWTKMSCLSCTQFLDSWVKLFVVPSQRLT